MKNVIKFLLFLFYATAIFFLPNGNGILAVFFINIFIMLLSKTDFKGVIKSIIHFLPFILLTFVINCILGYYIDAIWVAIKLLLVCNITFVYSKSTTITRICYNNTIVMRSFKTF